MYYQKFIDFLKKHNLYYEDVYEYWKNSRILFDYRDKDSRCFIGVYYSYQNDYLNEIKIIVPFIDNDQTLLINIHEYIHLLLFYKNLGKKYNPKDTQEVLPFFYENLFVKENKTEELLNYLDYLNKTIKKDCNKKYIIALNLCETLLKDYKNDNIFKLEKKVNKLVKKYNKKTSYI